MAKIKELPLNERPREKALLYGINSLSNAELLALILKNGYKDISVIELANNLLIKANGIENLSSISYKELISIKGISDVKALDILSIFELFKRISTPLKRIKIDVNYLKNYFSNLYQNEKQEKAFIVLLDNKNQLIFIKDLFKGNEHSLSFSPKLIVSFIVQYDAKKYYLIHNHPSGIPTPSQDDLISTSSIELITLSMSCTLVDHLIFGDSSFYSINQKQEFAY